jgi:uncharacterized protein (DUF983 family)
VKRDRPSIKDTLLRFLKLRCPACGRDRIIHRPFHIAERCNACHVIFKREEGFFVGAILINVVITEATILVFYFILIVVANFDPDYSIGFLFLVAVLFPLAFYHHSWSLWLTFDHFVEGLPRQ